MKSEPSPNAFAKLLIYGEPVGIRTRDLLIKSKCTDEATTGVFGLVHDTIY